MREAGSLELAGVQLRTSWREDMGEDLGLAMDDVAESVQQESGVSSELLLIVRSIVSGLTRKYKSDLYEPRDFVQEIWLKLISNDGQLLKQYDATRGKSLDSYIKMIVEREMFNILRKERAAKRSGHIAVECIEASAEPPSPVAFDTTLEARNLARKLIPWLCDRLSVLGIAVLQAVYVQGDDASDAALRLGLSTQAIYNWQHKIRAMSREFLSMDSRSAR